MGSMNCSEEFSCNNFTSELNLEIHTPKKKRFYSKKKVNDLTEEDDKMEILNLNTEMSSNNQYIMHALSPLNLELITLKKLTSSVDESSPTKIDKLKITDFEKLKVIGRGTFGKVIVVKNKINNRLYALKCLDKYVIIQKNIFSNVSNERKILSMISHPFIISLKFTFQSREKLFMAFDYHNGGELFFHLQNKQFFEEKLTKFYAAEIYHALIYLHNKSIIFRDLKPENIILDKEGHVKLIDFGLAKADINQDRQTYTFCGTSEYIPPEAINEQPYAFSFDWWTYGNIIYELIYGTPPFTDNDPLSLYKKICEKEPDYKKKEGVSSEAIDLIKQLLKKDVKDRIKPSDIPNHPWFKDLDFNEVLALKINPPFVPKIFNETDFSNIDPDFLSEEINSPYKTKFISKIEERYFSEF